MTILANQTPGLVGAAELSQYAWDIGEFSTLYPNQCFSDAAMTTPCVDGSPVYTWKNRTANGKIGNLVAPTAQYQPTYRGPRNANAVAGLPVVDFVEDDVIGAVLGSALAIPEWHLFAVFLLGDLDTSGNRDKFWGVEITSSPGTTRIAGFINSGDAGAINMSTFAGIGASFTPTVNDLIVYDFHYSASVIAAGANSGFANTSGMTYSALTWTGFALGGMRGGSYEADQNVRRLKCVSLHMGTSSTLHTDRLVIRNALREQACLGLNYVQR